VGTQPFYQTSVLLNQEEDFVSELLAVVAGAGLLSPLSLDEAFEPASSFFAAPFEPEPELFA
jgi:hypothetical protein